jgi:Ca2+-binding RTX toxin-like protein
MKRFSKSVSIGVECLEKRELLAGNIGFDAFAGRLTINGDNNLNDVAAVSIVNGSLVAMVGHRNAAGQFIVDDTETRSPAAVREIRFFGNGGNDSFQNDTSVRSFAFGQAGRDVLIGGSGRDLLNGGSEADELRGRGSDDILVGGSGNDSLFGGAGRDLLIGGLGADTLRGGTGEDILIGGTTNHDLNESSLLAIRSEWTRLISYQDRIAHLTGAATDGSNGTTLLRFANQSTDTVHDDGVVDRLFGEDNQDWFFSVDILNELQDRQLGPSTEGGERNN